MDVVVEGAHDGVGQAVGGVGEDVDYLHQGIAGHPECQRFGRYLQGGYVGLCSSTDVVPVHDPG